MISLENERKEIDEIDAELLPLLERRMRVCEKIASAKKQAGLRITDERREAAVLQKVSEASPNDLKTSLSGVFDSLMNYSKLHELALFAKDAPFTKEFGELLLQKKIISRKSVGITSEKVLKQAKSRYPDAKISCFSNTAALFEEFSAGHLDVIILPDRNERETSAEFFKSIAEKGYFLDAVFRVSAHYCLFGGLGIRRVSEVYGSEDALAHCSEFIKKYDLKAVPYTQPTALKMAAASGRTEIAVIAEAGSEFGLPLNILSDGIGNPEAPEEFYFALSREAVPEDSADRIALAFTVDDRPGRLAHVLSWFSALSVNLTRIETCRDHRRETFVFLECEGKPHDRAMMLLLGALSCELNRFVYLGAYPGA